MDYPFHRCKKLSKQNHDAHESGKTNFASGFRHATDREASGTHAYGYLSIPVPTVTDQDRD
jgi:hypothetical protein